MVNISKSAITCNSEKKFSFRFSGSRFQVQGFMFKVPGFKLNAICSTGSVKHFTNQNDW